MVVKNNPKVLDRDSVIIRGCVLYDDMTPVSGALVILEKFSMTNCNKENNQGCNNNCNNNIPSCTVNKQFNNQNECFKDEYGTEYTTTNIYGEYVFKIYNKKYAYKIKIFN